MPAPLKSCGLIKMHVYDMHFYFSHIHIFKHWFPRHAVEQALWYFVVHWDNPGTHDLLSDTLPANDSNAHSSDWYRCMGHLYIRPKSSCCLEAPHPSYLLICIHTSLLTFIMANAQSLLRSILEDSCIYEWWNIILVTFVLNRHVSCLYLFF